MASVVESQITYYEHFAVLTSEENKTLVETGPDTPMGTLMRSHWTPVCLIEEVAEPNCKPLLVEALGER
jgi:phthalate 4,5-dioxygenase oxygenase subunit